MKRFFLFSLFLDLFQPILARKEAMMVFSNFLNFFAIFLEFSITSQVGIHKNNFFFLSLSQPFLTYFGLKRNYDGVFWFFEFFCYFFRIFNYGSGWHTSEQFFLLSLFFGLIPPILAEKKLWWCFLIFLIFSQFF